MRTEAAANTGAGAGPGRPELGNTFEYSGEYADRGRQAVKWRNECFKEQFNCLFCSHTIERNQIRIVKTEP